MKFLSKFASILGKAGALVLGFGPQIGIFAPKVAPAIAHTEDVLSQIAAIVLTAEGFGSVNGLSGAQKLAGASAIASQVVLQSSILVGHKIKDSVKFQAAIAGITSNVADLLNSLDDDGIKSEEKA